MTNIIEAVFDGKVFHPDRPVPLKKNTRVRITIENLSVPENESISFLDTAESLDLQGPSDWSENVDKYLFEYDKKVDNECRITQ